MTESAPSLPVPPANVYELLRMVANVWKCIPNLTSVTRVNMPGSQSRSPFFAGPVNPFRRSTRDHLRPVLTRLPLDRSLFSCEPPPLHSSLPRSISRFISAVSFRGYLVESIQMLAHARARIHGDLLSFFYAANRHFVTACLPQSPGRRCSPIMSFRICNDVADQTRVNAATGHRHKYLRSTVHIT